MTDWTPPVHRSGGAVQPTSDFNAQVIDNLLFLHDGAPLWVGHDGPNDTGYTPTANEAVLFPVIPRDVITIAGLSYSVSNSAGNIDVGVYADDGNATTCTKLKTSGSVAMPAGTGAKTVNFTSSQLLEPYTKYWFAIAFSSTSARVWASIGPSVLVAKLMASALPLPSTITFGATPTAVPNLIGIAT